MIYPAQRDRLIYDLVLVWTGASLTAGTRRPFLTLDFGLWTQDLLSSGSLEGGHRVGREGLDIYTLDGAQADFVSREIHLTAGLDAGLHALAQIPVGKLAERSQVG